MSTTPQNASATAWGNAFSAILRDRVWQLFLLLSIAVALPFGPAAFRTNFAQLWLDPVMLVTLLAVIGYGLGRLGERERQFWALWSAAFACWLMVRLCFIVVPEARRDTAFDLATDCLYMLFYMLLLTAAVVGPHLQHRGGLSQKIRALQLVGSTVLVFGFLIYFVLIPGHVKPQLYQSWLPSFDLYVALDLLVALTYGVLARSCGNRRWAILYSLLATTAATWAIVDLLEGLQVTGRLAFETGAWTDFIWQVPALFVAAAARGRHLIADETDSSSSLHPMISALRLRSPLALSAVALPTVHFALHALGLGDADLQPSRQLLVLTCIVLLTGLALVEQSLLRDEIVAAAEERQRSEKRAIERTTYLDALIDQSPLAIASLDADYRVTLCNPAFEDLFGYRLEEIQGQSLIPYLFNPEQIEEARRLGHNVLDGERVNAVTQRQHKDGRTVNVELFAVPLVIEGELVGILASYRDLSEQMRAESGRRLIEQRLRRLTEATFEGIAVVEGQKIRDVNEQLAELFGYEGQELIDLTPGELLTPMDRPKLEAMLADARQRPVELEGLRRDRSTFRVEVRARETEGDEPECCILAIRDLTERVELEAQLQQAQKMEAIGRLAGGIAHDFNNLLTVVVGRCELLAHDADANQLQGLEEIKHAAEMAAALTRQLLVFARKQNPRPERLDLSAVASSTAETMLRRLIPENVGLELDLEKERSLIRADRSQIEQLILNFALNAQDAMPDGGLLTVKTSLTELADGFSNYGLEVASGTYLKLTVSDTGVGIADDILPRLFDPFFTTKDAGTGLGLATVYGIVRQSSGALDVESTEGWGSSFHVYFPVERAAAPAADEPASGFDLGREGAAAASERNEVVMVVEDVAEIGAMLGTFLERQGYEVLRASLPRDALELAAQHEGAIDLLITDVVMPEMSGPVLARKVQQDRPEVKVLFISGYAHEDLRKQIDDTDAAFLRKPFALSDLSRTVRTLLGDRSKAA